MRMGTFATKWPQLSWNKGYCICIGGMRLRNYLFLALVVCVFWILFAYTVIHWMEGPSDDVRVQQLYEAAGRDLSERLNFRVDNLDARNIRQMADLRQQIDSLRARLDAFSLPNSISESHMSKRSVTDNAVTKVTSSSSDLGGVNKDAIAVLVLACNRESFVKRVLDKLLDLRPSAQSFPIIVSQDCGDQGTAQQISSYGDKITFIKQPDQSPIADLPAREKKFEGYYKIARHYKWALNQVFSVMGHEYVLIVEDDLEIAPDFFSYFSATKWLLDNDPTIWCVSAWNDNGKEGYVSGNEVLYRSDFFPGLGWMLKRELWRELEPIWPKGYWDDWLRDPDQRKDRVCIRPEVSRTKTFGFSKGVSKGEFSTILRQIKLNDRAVDWSTIDLHYLLKDNYDRQYLARVYSAPEVTVQEVLSGARPELTEVRVTYVGAKSFELFAKQLKIMSDLKAGVPRAAYHGIVSIFYQNRRVFLSPPKP